MDTQIELSAAQWYSLLAYLDPNSSVYSTVKSAIEIAEAPITTPLGRVALTCNRSEATVMLHAAQRFFPELVPRIMTALEPNHCR